MDLLSFFQSNPGVAIALAAPLLFVVYQYRSQLGGMLSSPLPGGEAFEPVDREDSQPFARKVEVLRSCHFLSKQARDAGDKTALKLINDVQVRLLACHEPPQPAE